ncbi:MAG: AmmeMemoRadiSam system radical SAM enzyme [Eubacteriales bacterium]|nr:AmmeMemoRadiSam system radical SAM enzyme [Eubacteriales bacterium]
MNHCPLCHRQCRLREGQTGFCQARIMRDGASRPLGYGKVTSIALDPIEKKPLARFHPGKKVLSVGSFGCNMACYFCQNHEIARAGEKEIPWRGISPRALCEMAREMVPQGNIGLAFTYNEPMLNVEYIADCADILRPMGLKTVVVTNGCFCLDAVGEVLPKVDAFNIDLKGFTPEWYRRLGGDLDTVKDFITAAHKASHVEVTTLVVSGRNDSPEEIAALAAWLAGISPKIPLHLSRCFPRFHAEEPPTDRQALKKLKDLAGAYLDTVLLGNM